jgi:hypothetical protein
MKRETTPARITEKIKELCDKVVTGTEPEYLPVTVQEWCLPRECFPNVDRMAKKHGGRRVNGWTIWQWANVFVEAEAHAVWESPNGKLIDITPHDYGEKEILFLRDEEMIYSGKKFGNIKLALTDSPLVAELIDLTKRVESVLCEYDAGTGIPVAELQQRLGSVVMRQKVIMAELYRETGPNEFCSCQSGLKYKKCCGKQE